MKKEIIIWALSFVLFIGVAIGLSYAFGWIGVHQTKTIKKAQKDADRQVFEQSQSYIEGKRQEALKFYQEYKKCDDSECELSIKNMVLHSFSNFDENLLNEPIKSFISDCKYN